MPADNPKIRHPMNAPPWREAASLILACRTPMSDIVGSDLADTMIAMKLSNGSQATDGISRFDYKVLMVKRSQLSSYMANAYVFPGGLAEKSDFSLEWLKVFEQCGVSFKQLRDEFVDCVEGPRPPIIEKPVTISHNERIEILNEFLPADIALRICAIREAFEETGVLLVTSEKPDLNLPMCSFERDIGLSSCREKLRSEPRALLDLCLENKLCPNLWIMHEWWDWLTPISVGHRRYDTMFYVACLDQLPNVVLDQSEVVKLRWTTPLAILEEYSAGSVFLAPPQVYEMSRLATMYSFNNLSKLARERERLGIERWMPVVGAVNDGVVALLPGDDLYPAEPDIYGKGPGPEYPYSLEEVRQRCENLNRMDVQGPFACAHCNISPPRGIPSPISYVGTNQLNFQSLL